MTTDVVDEVDWTADSGSIHKLERYKRLHAEDVVAAICEDAERIKRREAEGALDKLEARGDLSGDQRDVIEEMTDAIIDQLLAVPITRIFEVDDGPTLDTTVRLFDLELELADAETHADGSHRSEAVNDDE